MAKFAQAIEETNKTMAPDVAGKIDELVAVEPTTVEQMDAVSDEFMELMKFTNESIMTMLQEIASRVVALEEMVAPTEEPVVEEPMVEGEATEEVV